MKRLYAIIFIVALSGQAEASYWDVFKDKSKPEYRRYGYTIQTGPLYFIPVSYMSEFTGSGFGMAFQINAVSGPYRYGLRAGYLRGGTKEYETRDVKFDTESYEMKPVFLTAARRFPVAGHFSITPEIMGGVSFTSFSYTEYEKNINIEKEGTVSLIGSDVTETETVEWREMENERQKSLLHPGGSAGIRFSYRLSPYIEANGGTRLNLFMEKDDTYEYLFMLSFYAGMSVLL